MNFQILVATKAVLSDSKSRSELINRHKEETEMKKTMGVMAGLGLILVLILGLIVAGLLCASSPEPKIVFIGEDDNAYVADINGKNPRKITSGGEVSCARWLDADTVAVLVSRLGDPTDETSWRQDIWLVQVTGEGKKTRLSRSGAIRSFACSPDGKWIAFTGEPGLCRINRDGSGFRVLRRGHNPDLRHCYATNPFFAVAQDTVFYSTWSIIREGEEREMDEKIWNLDSQGKQDKCIYTSPSGSIASLVSSRDGRRIIFSVNDADPSVFYVKEINTSDFQVRTLAELKVSRPVDIDWKLCSFMPSEEQILLGRNTFNPNYPRLRLDIVVLDLKPGAEPKLLIRDAWDADVWYPEM